MTEVVEHGSVLEQAAKELNEKDAKGVVAKIKTLMLLVVGNDAEIEKLTASNKKLKQQISELASTGPLSAESFTVA